ncbi:unnamed protein product [Closterium sp. Naga37s-1]|nr:unnamed protein product [Closterium sp. Naga37s-1]
MAADRARVREPVAAHPPAPRQTATAGGSSSGGGGGGATLNYTDALVKSILFFDAQRSGRISGAGARMPTSVAWRNNSGLGDGAAQMVDLEGGYYEGGSNVKYGLPAAFATTLLAWSLIDFRRHLEAAGGAAQLTAARNALRWSTDYLVKAHTGMNELWAQVGDPVAESACWQRPEDMSTARTAYRVNASHPGSDLAAETAAALAAASLALRPVDGSYASTLLGHAEQVTHRCCCRSAPCRVASHRHNPPLTPPSLHARSLFLNAPSLISLPSTSPPLAQLFVFADTYRGSYSDAVPQARRFSTSGEGSSYQDELAWAAVWLHRATGYAVYVDYLVANDAWIRGSEQLQLEMSWQHKLPGVQVLIAQMMLQGVPAALSTSVAAMAVLEGYRGMADLFVCAHMPANPLRAVYTTPGGLLHVRASNAQLALGAAFLLALHSDSLAGSAQVVQCEGVTFAPPAILAFAQSQVTLAPRPAVSPTLIAPCTCQVVPFAPPSALTVSNFNLLLVKHGWALPHHLPPLTPSRLPVHAQMVERASLHVCASTARRWTTCWGATPWASPSWWASAPPSPCACTTAPRPSCEGGVADWLNRDAANPNVLVGAIVGGPDAGQCRLFHRATCLLLCACTLALLATSALTPALCVPSVCPLCALCVPSVCPLCALCVPSVCPLCALCVPSVCPLCALCLPSVCPLSALCVPSVCPLSALCVSSVCPLSALCLPSVCPLCALCLPSVCPLPVLCLTSALGPLSARVPAHMAWQSDAFQDSRVLPSFTEPSACANAPAVGLLARLAAGTLPPAPPPPPFPPAPPSPPPRPPASPPPLCSVSSFFCPSPPPPPTSPAGPTVDPAALVTVACEVTGGWQQYGEQQSRWSCVVANTGSAFPVRDFRLRCHDFEPSQAWNMDALSCQLPWWATHLAPNDSISFGFVQSAAVVPSFTVESLVSLAPPPPPFPPPSPPLPPNPPPRPPPSPPPRPPPNPPPKPPPSPPPKPPPNSPPRPPPNPPPRPPPNPPPSPPPRPPSPPPVPPPSPPSPSRQPPSPPPQPPPSPPQPSSPPPKSPAPPPKPPSPPPSPPSPPPKPPSPPPRPPSPPPRPPSPPPKLSPPPKPPPSHPKPPSPPPQPPPPRAAKPPPSPPPRPPPSPPKPPPRPPRPPPKPPRPPPKPPRPPPSPPPPPPKLSSAQGGGSPKAPKSGGEKVKPPPKKGKRKSPPPPHSTGSKHPPPPKSSKPKESPPPGGSKKDGAKRRRPPPPPPLKSTRMKRKLPPPPPSTVKKSAR